MIDEKLNASLEAGRPWVAHGELPDQDDCKVGITVGLRKLPKGSFHVAIETYFVEGLYGTDISHEAQEFETLEAALEFIEAKTGMSPEKENEKRPPLRERRRFK